MTRAQSLRQETALNSITPERAGGIMYDTAALLNQQQLQGTNPLLISKIYASIEAMEADDNPVSDITGEALKPGQIVVISTSQPDEPDEGLVYRFNGIVEEVSSWTCVGKIGSSPYLEGYQFMGKAVLTPTPTDPGVPTQKVFYQATEPGTYTNFGGTVVADGEVVNLKWDGTAWSKEAVVGLLKVVPDSVNGGYRLVLVGQDVAHVTEQADHQELQNALVNDDFETLTPASVIENKVVQDTGLIGSTSYNVWVYAVVPGKNLVLNSVLPVGIDRRSVYYSSDAAGANIVGWDKYKGDSGSTDMQYFAGPLTIPAGANYILVNVRNAGAFLDKYKVSSIARGPLVRSKDLILSVDEINGGFNGRTRDGIVGLANQRDVQQLNNALVGADFEELTPTVIENKVVQDTGLIGSTSYNVWVVPITAGKNYVITGLLTTGNDRRLVYYSSDAAAANIVGWDQYKGDSAATSAQYFAGPLTIPPGANYILMNVRNLALYEGLGVFSIKQINRAPLLSLNSVAKSHRLKCVVKDDGTFYVRFHLSDTLDGILVFDYGHNFNFVKNSLTPDLFYLGSPDALDREILASDAVQDCHDTQGPVSTENFGPIFSNHGYNTPRVRVPGNTLTDADLGSEWVDQSGYHYTLGHIDGEWLYLLPVIDTTGGPGHETRGWKSYTSPMPTELTRNAPGGETLTVTDARRYDYQVGEMVNTRILIGGNPVGPGEYYCDEVVLSYLQIGYNPIEIDTWWPSPVYEGVMFNFAWNYAITGGDGFLAVTTNTLANNKYPFPLAGFWDTQPMFPFQVGNFVPYAYIPKLKKHTDDIDLRAEFASPNSSSFSAVPYLRNSTDLVDVDDMPDRAYCYLKDGDGAVLFGCAGGHSLVRGMSVKSVRNQNIADGDQVGSWSPSSGNKFYSRVMTRTGETDNMLPTSFIGEFEGYLCWYMPRNNVHAFYHRTKEGYVVYIHTKETIAKGGAVLPDFMNNLAVVQTIEKTAGIDLLTNTVIDGKLYFTADASEVEYNYIVVLVK